MWVCLSKSFYRSTSVVAGRAAGVLEAPPVEQEKLMSQLLIPIHNLTKTLIHAAKIA